MRKKPNHCKSLADFEVRIMRHIWRVFVGDRTYWKTGKFDVEKQMDINIPQVPRVSVDFHQLRSTHETQPAGVFMGFRYSSVTEPGCSCTPLIVY